MKSNLVDIFVEVHVKTKLAVLVSDDGNKEKAVWLPLSQIEIEPSPSGLFIITLPEWLAIDKGFF